MNILSEVNDILSSLNIPIETGVFSGTAPDRYIVLVPLTDSYPLNGDDTPLIDEQELRISIYSKINYIQLKNAVTAKLLSNYFFITDRRYNGYDTETGYHQYTIDVAKQYEIEEETN